MKLLKKLFLSILLISYVNADRMGFDWLTDDIEDNQPAAPPPPPSQRHGNPQQAQIYLESANSHNKNSRQYNSRSNSDPSQSGGDLKKESNLRSNSQNSYAQKQQSQNTAERDDSTYGRGHLSNQKSNHDNQDSSRKNNLFASGENHHQHNEISGTKSKSHSNKYFVDENIYRQDVDGPSGADWLFQKPSDDELQSIKNQQKLEKENVQGGNIFQRQRAESELQNYYENPRGGVQFEIDPERLEQERKREQILIEHREREEREREERQGEREIKIQELIKQRDEYFPIKNNKDNIPKSQLYQANHKHHHYGLDSLPAAEVESIRQSEPNRKLSFMNKYLPFKNSAICYKSPMDFAVLLLCFLGSIAHIHYCIKI